MAEGSGQKSREVADAPSNFKSKVWAHFGFYKRESGMLDKGQVHWKHHKHTQSLSAPSSTARSGGEASASDANGSGRQPTCLKSSFLLDPPRLQVSQSLLPTLYARISGHIALLTTKVSAVCYIRLNPDTRFPADNTLLRK